MVILFDGSFDKDECKRIMRGDAALFKEFDIKYNVDTGSPLELSNDGRNELKPVTEYGDNGIHPDWNEYMSTALYWLDIVNEYFINNVKNINNFTFVDIGAGKGKVILYNILKKIPYKKYVAIENDKKFYDILNNNFKNTNIQIDKKVDLIFKNAIELDYSTENNIYFFFYPFSKNFFDKFINQHINDMKNKNNYFVFIFKVDYEPERFFGLPIFKEKAVTIYKF